jgi:hypothetical protein
MASGNSAPSLVLGVPNLQSYRLNRPLADFEGYWPSKTVTWQLRRAVKQNAR